MAGHTPGRNFPGGSGEGTLVAGEAWYSQVGALKGKKGAGVRLNPVQMGKRVLVVTILAIWLSNLRVIALMT